MTAEIQLRGPKARYCFGDLRELEREARFWSFALAQREWWADSDRRRYYMADLARGTLVDVLKLDPQGLKQVEHVLSGFAMLEVVIPEGSEAGREGAVTMPWEYVLTAPLGQKVGSYPPTVARCLDNGQSAPQPRRERRLLYIQSLPGELAGHYDFDEERKLPNHLVDENQIDRLENPSWTQIRNCVEEIQPDVIHLAGVDTHQGCTLCDEDIEHSPDSVSDGMVLRGRGGKASDVNAAKLAEALCAGERKPELVLFNLYNSAADLGYEAVRAGAEAAVGFQHIIDDALAELFIAELYRMLGPRQLPLSSALVAARQRLGSSAETIHGTGFVLWSRFSRLQEWGSVSDDEFENAVYDRVKPDPDEDDPDPDEAEREGSRSRNEPSVVYEPLKRINYALLHNRRPLFRRFEIRKDGDEVVSGIDIDVELRVGSLVCPYRLRENLGTRVTDLRSKIRLPLIWKLHDLPTERVQTTLTTRVSWGKHPLLVRSDPIVLQPVDLWKDDDVNRQWLPTFILPRDPAVRRIIAAAQSYLDALSDDFNAGFDGYQSVDPTSADPFARIDAQAQAIWNALVQDFSLRYVNPPPTFELLSQRLRSPSDVLEGGRGTCIDLALLMAACLEYVEIIPAVFLLEGHAFVGYWRSEEGYFDAIDQLLLSPDPDPDLDVDQGLPESQHRARFGTTTEQVGHPWIYGKRFYRPVFNLVHGWQQLVPLETTGIPFRSGFWDAVDQGSQNLRSVHDFHALIDVASARDHSVTPLPYERREQ